MIKLILFITMIILLSTSNLPYFIFVSLILSYNYLFHNHINNQINYIIILLIGLPSGFNGQNVINLNLYLIFIFMLSTIKISNNFKLSIIYNFIFLLLFIFSLIIYFPIIFSTYFNINIFDFQEIKLVSNNRPSHMFGFAAPLILIGILVKIIVSFFTMETNFNELYKVLVKITFFVIFLSLIRFIFEINLIPQDYTEIRYDGNRLTGITNPDALGFARSLLFPLSICGAYYFANMKNKLYLFYFLTILFTLYASISRTVFLSTTVIISIIIFYNYTKKKFNTYFNFFIIFVILFLFSGIGISLLERNTVDGNLNVSGRDAMWITALYAISTSPITGLRPGGWQIWLQNGVEWASGSDVVVQSTHSFYLETAVTWGLPITFFLICIFLFSIYKLHKSLNLYKRYISTNSPILNWAIGIQAITIGLMFHGITENIHIYLWFSILAFSISVNTYIKSILHNANISGA
jgi:hypothetical protein